MGSSSSKESIGSSPLIWKGSSATNVSHDLAEVLQSSNETDGSRLQTLELQVQARVASELKRLHEEESAALKTALEKLSADSSNSDDNDNDNDGGMAALGTSRQAVAREVETLRAKLEARRQRARELPASVDAARSEVVRCLRENERRPLDCWREVERFKEEVRRLEKGWVEKVVS